MGGGLAKSLRKKDILIIGLDNAGKTTLFKQLEGQLKVAQDEIETTPTIGCNNDQVGYKGLKLNVVDMGGRDSVRPTLALFLSLHPPIGSFALGWIST
jgi:small GTP-binding protein